MIISKITTVDDHIYVSTKQLDRVSTITYLCCPLIKNTNEKSGLG